MSVDNGAPRVDRRENAGAKADSRVDAVHPWLRWTAAATLPLSILLVVLFGIQTNSGLVYDSPLLLFVLNTLFISIVSFVVAYIAARAYIRSGINRLVLLGCGTLVFGLGSLVSGVLLDAPDGPNQAVTVYNIAALVAGLFHLSVGGLFISRVTFGETHNRRMRRVILAYLGIAVFTAALVFATVRDLIPPFFVQGIGATSLRQFVLSTAIALWALAAFFLVALYRQTKIAFHFWYGLALALTAVGLGTVFFQSATGSLISWVGRSVQYLGGVYFLAAIATLWRSRQIKGIALEIQVADFFRESEANYRALVETVTDALVAIDEKGRILLWNPAAERMFGYTAAEALGAVLVDLVLPADSADHARREWEGYTREGSSSLLGKPLEVLTRRKNGKLFLVEYTVSARRKANRWNATVIARDITERKQAEELSQKLYQTLEQQAEELEQMNLSLEEALAEEQVAREEAESGRNTLESLMQYAPEAIFIADAPDANIRMVSQYVEQTTGRPLPQLTGVPAGAHPVSQDLFRVDGTTPMAFEELPIVRAIQRGETVLDQEMILQRPGGEKRTILANAGPIRDGKGNITGGIAVWRDITSRKQIEQQVVQLNRDLQQHAVELEAANKELESFSYSVSHDLRMPLASINGFTGILLKDYGDRLPADVQRFLELIRSNSTAMNELVEGLLRFSRSIRQPLQKQKVDANQLACQALEELKAQQGERRVEFVLQQMPACQADPLLLKQVMINLLSNALKFTRPRETARIEIGATASQDGETVYFVRDNGVGFDEKQAERLFGVFQRLHSQEEYEGTGVGLAIVERIIRRHGGRVWAEARVDEGATFFFTLGPGNGER